MSYQCAVQRCINEGTEQFTVKPKREWADTAITVAVCEDHAAQLGDLETEWLYERSEDPVTKRVEPSLILGEDLQGLDEYILAAEPGEVISYGPNARVFSHPGHHDGHHIPIVLRRRGSREYQEMTLVIPYDKLPALLDLLKTLAYEN